MWKEHRVILGLQTPAGAIQSKFGLEGDPELLSCITGHAQPPNEIFFARWSKAGSRKPLFYPQISSPCPSLKYSSRAGMKATRERGDMVACLQVKLRC